MDTTEPALLRDRLGEEKWSAKSYLTFSMIATSSSTR